MKTFGAYTQTMKAARQVRRLALGVVRNVGRLPAAGPILENSALTERLLPVCALLRRLERAMSRALKQSTAIVQTGEGQRP